MRDARMIVTTVGLSLMFGTALPATTEATPTGFSVGRVGHSRLDSKALPFRRRRSASASTCSGSGNPSFLAFNGENNVAGALASSILGGQNNEACDGASSIAAGQGNAIGNSGSAVSSFIGGGISNMVIVDGSFIGSGFENTNEGEYAFIGSGDANMAQGQYSFVGAGSGNVASGSASAVAGGNSNAASSSDSFVGSGEQNFARGSGSFVGAGGFIYTSEQNKTGVANFAAGLDSFIGAGDQNEVEANDAFLGGGNLNEIESGGTDGTIAGGSSNVLTGQKAAIGGGESNEAEGSFASIPGGYRNEALGNESFAAGSQAEARHTGSFVWSDYVSTEKPQTDSRPGEFVARASGGVYFFSNAASSSGVQLTPGSGSWSSLSDRNAKTDVVPLDDASVLSKVAALPVDAWRYKTESGVRHVGPMAQDFYAAFGVGEDDRHITSIDEDGVALAAIKALNAKLATEHRENGELRSEVVLLRAELHQVEAAMTRGK